MADRSELHHEKEMALKIELEFNIEPEQLQYPDIYYDLVGVKSEPSKDMQIFTCDLCDDTFNEHIDHPNLHKEMAACSNPVQDDNITTNNSAQIQPGQNKYNCHHRNSLECKICDKKFSKKWNFELHTRQHTGEKPFSCSVCNKAFAAKSVRRVHMRIHSKERQFQCASCNKKFLNKSHLIEHIRTHAGTKPFECTVCSKKFSQNSKLTVHMRTHTGEKPFMCAICQRSFPYKDSLEKHIRMHTGVKPYECTVCNRKLSSASNLKVHMKVHNRPPDFRAARANGFSPSDTDNLKKWQKGNDPKCKCGKEFKLIWNLVSHVRVHTGEKPFECAECGNRFKGKSSLSKHLKNGICTRRPEKKKTNAIIICSYNETAYVIKLLTRSKQPHSSN